MRNDVNATPYTFLTHRTHLFSDVHGAEYNNRLMRQIYDHNIN